MNRNRNMWPRRKSRTTDVVRVTRHALVQGYGLFDGIIFCRDGP